MKIKEILKTDSLAGSRILINNNFKSVKTEIGEIDEFFIFDEEGNRIALTSPYIDSDEIRTKTIKGKNELKAFINELLCIAFNEDGDLLIRQNSKCELNVRAKLEELASNRIDIEGIANQVEAELLRDTVWLGNLKNTLITDNAFINALVSRILQNTNFKNQIISWIQEYAPTPAPTECTDFSIYARTSELWLHCNKEHDRSNDMKLSDYIPVEGDVLTIRQQDIQPIINEYYDETGDKFKLTYTDEHLIEEKVITEDGTYIDYGLDGEGPESKIVAENLGTDSATYIITKLR